MLTLNFNPFPVLSTTRLLLRQICAADVNEVFELRASKEVMKFVDRPLAESSEDALEFIQKNIDIVKNNEGISWAISFKNDAALIGTIGLWRIDKDNHRGEIGYLLHPSHQQKGVMHEALNAVLDYGFNNMCLHSVEANVNPANEASKKLLEKNKFIQEAYFRENYYYNGQFLDSAIYSLLTPVI